MWCKSLGLGGEVSGLLVALKANTKWSIDCERISKLCTNHHQQSRLMLFPPLTIDPTQPFNYLRLSIASHNEHHRVEPAQEQIVSDRVL